MYFSKFMTIPNNRSFPPQSCIGVYTCGNVCMYIFVTLWIYEYNNSLHGVIWCLIGPPNI